MRALNALVSEAIDIVVHCERGPNGPRVTEIIAVEDLQAGPDSTTFTTTQIFALRDEQLVWSGAVPTRLSHVHDFGGS